MINIFGGNYDEIGSTNKNLILKTQGKIKIQWGKKFIDLIDNDGNINSKLQKLINKVNSLDNISKDGFYIYDGSLYAKYGDDILSLQNQDSDALYVSFVTEQETTSEQKYTALKNLGLVYPTLSNVNNIPTNGIIYNEYDKSLYIVDNGVLSKYYLEIPNPYTKQFVIAKEGDGNGALVINGEGIENSLYFNDLQIYNQQAYAYYKSLKDHKFYVGNQSVVDITGSGIETNEIKSKGFSYDTGYAIQQEGSDYILYIDDIHVRKGIKAEAIKNIIPVRIYKEENVIIDSRVVNTTTEDNITIYNLNLFFKYNNDYQVGDKLRIYVESPDKENNEVNKVYPIELKVITTHTGSTKLNYVVVEYIPNENHPNNVLEYFNNTVCYLYSRKEIIGYDEENNNEPIYSDIKNEDLVIGNLSEYNASNTGYGIISKNNKFYSAIFDKNKDIVEQDETYKNGLFPVYSQELYDRLKFHYDEQSYEKVIPPLGIINELNKDYYVGTCDISGQNKIITLSPSTTQKFNIRAGTILKVIFSVNNQYSASNSNPIGFTIRYNERTVDEDTQYDWFPSSNTYKLVYYLNTIKEGTDPNVYGKADKSITYIYDGTYWNWLSGGSDATLNPILNDINIQNEQSEYLPKDSINNNYYQSNYHRDYMFSYAGIGEINGSQLYKYRWIPILKDGNVDNEIPSKGLLIYNPTQNLNRIRVVQGNSNNNDQYLTCKDSDFKWSNIVTMLTSGDIDSPRDGQYLKYNSSNNGKLQWDYPSTGNSQYPNPSTSGYLYYNNTTGEYSWNTPQNGGGTILNPTGQGTYIYTYVGEQQWTKVNVEDLVNSINTLKQQTQLSNLDIKKNNSSIVGQEITIYARDTEFKFNIISNATWKAISTVGLNTIDLYGQFDPETGNGNKEVKFETTFNTNNYYADRTIQINDFFGVSKQFTIKRLSPVIFSLNNPNNFEEISADGGTVTFEFISSFDIKSTSISNSTFISSSYTENGNSGTLTIVVDIIQNNSNSSTTQNCSVTNKGNQVCSFEYTQLGNN